MSKQKIIILLKNIVCLLLMIAMAENHLCGQRWVATPLGDMANGDTLLIVDTVSGMALPNDHGASGAPPGIALSLGNDKSRLETGMPIHLQWILCREDTCFVFRSVSDSSKWLYAINSNNGVRVGVNKNRHFTLYAGHWLYNVETARYVGVYSATDWRCYTTAPASGTIKNTRTAFYKYEPPCFRFVYDTLSGCDSVIKIADRDVRQIYYGDTVIQDTAVDAQHCKVITQWQILVRPSPDTLVPSPDTLVPVIDTLVPARSLRLADTVWHLPYNRYYWLAAEIPLPTLPDTFVVEHVDSLRQRVPDTLWVNTDYELMWLYYVSQQQPDTCKQKVTIKFPPCGEENNRCMQLVDNQGNRYDSQRIGGQCWMTENLRCDGRFVVPDSLNVVPLAYLYHSVVFPDSDVIRLIYGRLYNWRAATDSLCPSGWRLPSKEDFQLLAWRGAHELSATEHWLNTDNTNSSGFNAMPGGYYDSEDRRFYQLLGDAYYWTSSSYSASDAWAFCLHYSCEEVKLVPANKSHGYSVRCLKE